MSPKPPLPTAVIAALRAVRRRRRALASLRCLGWIAAGLSVLVPLAVLASHAPASLAPWLRPLAWVLLLAALITPCVAVLLPVWRRTRSLLDLARAVDDRVPATRDSLFCAVDLASGIEIGRLRDDAETRRLTELHFTQAALDAAHVVPRELLPSSLVGRIGPGGLALLALALLGRSLWPGPVDAGLALLFGSTTEDGDEVDGAAPAVTLALRDVQITLTPPAYAGRDPLLLEGTTGDFQALPGTWVRWQAVTSSRGDSPTLLWPGQEPVEGELRDGRIRFEFVVPKGGGYRVMLDPRMGGEPLRSRRFRVSALPDDPPRLDVEAPAGELQLREGGDLPLRVRASDDFALQELVWVLRSGGDEIARGPIAEVQGQGSWEGAHRWFLPDAGAKRGGRLDLIIEARDNNSWAGFQVTRSRPIELVVPSEADQHRRSLDLKQRLSEQAIDLLGMMLVDSAELASRLDDPRGRHSRVALLQEHATHETAVKGFLETASQLDANMRDDHLAKTAAWLGIGQLVDNLRRGWEDVDRYAQREFANSEGTYMHSVFVDGYLQVEQVLVGELERIVLDLSAFIDLHQGRQALAQAADAEQTMADLSEILRKAEDGEPQVAALDAALRQLRDQLARMAKELAKRSPGADDGFLNKLPRDLGPDLSAELKKLAEEGRYEEAMARLQEAMDALAAMQDRLGDEQQEMAGGQQAEQLDRQLGEALAEAQHLAEQQRDLIRETDALAEQFQAQDGGDPSDTAALQAGIEELRRQIAALGREQIPRGMQQYLRTRIAAVEAMAEVLEDERRQGDLDGALQSVRDVERQLQDAAGRMGAMSDLSEGAARESEGAGEAAAKAGQIAQQLQLQRRSREKARRQARRAGEGARGRQQGLAEGVARLRQQVEGIGGSAYNPAASRKNLEQAGQFMQRASGRLGQGSPGTAGGSQRDALQQLEEFQRSIEQSKSAMSQPGQMGGQPQAGRRGEGGSEASRRDNWDRLDQWSKQQRGGPVEMPDAEDFVTPDAFRALVQEGAADEGPERFEPLKKNYYEELVR